MFLFCGLCNVYACHLTGTRLQSPLDVCRVSILWRLGLIWLLGLKIKVSFTQGVKFLSAARIVR